MSRRLSIPCPECGQHQNKVIDSRPRLDGSIRRRRKCSCGFRYTTSEGLFNPEQKREKLNLVAVATREFISTLKLLADSPE